VAYRPSCIDCSACVSVRVVAREFRASSTQRRIFRRNEDLVVSEARPWATAEQFDLLRKYLGARHPGGGMAQMDEVDFADMVEHTPVTSFVIEYREPGDGITPGRLVGACLTDRQGDGLSMIYSFYDPEHEARPGLGNFIILDHIRRAARIGLPYVYLGYWVEGSERMQYKVRYRPLERLGREGWERISDAEQDELIHAVARARRESAAADAADVAGCKDGMEPIRESGAADCALDSVPDSVGRVFA
jgi:arginine-tRNA-protein transferase